MLRSSSISHIVIYWEEFGYVPKKETGTRKIVLKSDLQVIASDRTDEEIKVVFYMCFGQQVSVCRTL